MLAALQGAAAMKTSKRSDHKAGPLTGKRRLQLVGTTLLGLLVAYVIYLVLAVLIQRRVIFPRHLADAPYGPPQSWPQQRRIWLETDEGRTEVWFVPAQTDRAGTQAPAVLFAHGNAELIDHQWAVVRGYRRLGVSVMLCEYRGYGRSGGTPTQRHLVADFRRCYELLTQMEEVDSNRIILHGRSIGTGVVSAVAAECRPAAVVLRSPFLSVRRLAATWLIPPFLVRDPFDNVAALRAYGGPVLILHGDRDRVIPVAHGRKLATLIHGAQYIEYRGYGHNDFPEDSYRHWRDIARFLTAVGVLR